MKKCIGLIFVLISMFSFYILFNDEHNIFLSNIKNAELTSTSYEIIIPSEVSHKKPLDTYNAIKNTLDKYEANMYHTQTKNNNNKIEYIKYVYFSNLNYLSDFKLSNGEYLKLSDNESNKFLSTENTKEQDQVGTISSFGQGEVVNIYTLKSMINKDIPFEGYFTVQLNDMAKMNNFMNDLSEALNVKIQQVKNNEVNNPIFNPVYLVIAILYILIILLILYDLLNSYKQIGIEKMLGFKNKSIWIKRLTPLIIIQTVSSLLVSVVLIVYKIKDYNYYFFEFLKKLILINGEMIILSIFILSIPFIYINKITVSNMLKNRKPIKAIIIFNNIFKTILTSIVLILIIKVYHQYSSVHNTYDKYLKQWESTKQFAVIPTLENIPQESYLHTKEFLDKQKELYLYFNKNGSILANFYNFTEKTRELNTKDNRPRYETDLVTVNPNYLKENNIYDLNGNVINIDESEKDFILLIPVKYKSNESDIRRYYDHIKKGYVETVGDKEIPTVVVNQEVRIVWTKNDQELFSYQIDINPKEGNRIIDPIVRVTTESNGAPTDYDRVLAYAGNPFKIKVDNQLDIYGSIQPKLHKLNLDKYVTHIYSVYDLNSSRVQEIKGNMKVLLTLSAILFSLIAIIIIQNIYNYFEQNKKILVVKQFLGYKRRDKYKKYLILNCKIWIITFVISFLLSKVVNVEFKELLRLTSILIVGEFLLSTLTLILVEKRKVIKVVKGG